MIIRAGDLLESNHSLCNRFKLVSFILTGKNIRFHCRVISPDVPHRHNSDAYFGGGSLMTIEGNKIIDSFLVQPNMGYYSALSGKDNTSPRRLEFVILKKKNDQEQLDLFGDVI